MSPKEIFDLVKEGLSNGIGQITITVTGLIVLAISWVGIHKHNSKKSEERAQAAIEVAQKGQTEAVSFGRRASDTNIELLTKQIKELGERVEILEHDRDHWSGKYQEEFERRVIAEAKLQTQIQITDAMKASHAVFREELVERDSVSKGNRRTKK